MKNPSNSLRSAYFQALNGNVTVNGQPIKVYNKVLDENTGDAYIILSNETGRRELSKCRDLREQTLLIDIVTKFPPYDGSNELANDIQEQVSQLVDTGIELDLGPDFQSVLTEEEDSHDIDLQTPAETIIRKLIRYRHLININ